MGKYAGEVKKGGRIHTKLEGKTKTPPETLTLHLFTYDDRMKHKVWPQFQGSKSVKNIFVASLMCRRHYLFIIGPIRSTEEP